MSDMNIDPGSSHKLHLDDIINAESFHKIQESMAVAADMAMLTVDFAGKPVTEHSRCSAFCTLVRSRPELSELCRKCDSRGGIEAARLGEPYIYKCHMGLIDLAVPIIVEKQYIGAIMAGQVLISNPAECASLETIARTIPLDAAGGDADFASRLEACRRELPVSSLGRVQAHARMMFQVCNYIVDEAMLKMQLAERNAGMESPIGSPLLTDPNRPRLDNPLLAPALDYIKNHYARNIRMEELSRLCRISTSYFSKLFNAALGENVPSYINRIRVHHARKLLLDSDKPIIAIALQLGFEDSGYFDKVFKKLIGQTPKEFRQRGQSVPYN